MSGEGFLGRWSKRKLDVKEGRPVQPEPEIAPPSPPVVPVPAAAAPVAAEEAPAAAEPAPTLEDAQALTAESDFRRFVGADVPADVKNTALKKLFTDPRYNIQDGLDVYIDDYGKPDPIPPEMLKYLMSSKFLNTIEEKVEGREVADDPPARSVAELPEAEQAVPPPEPHADPDLRLQQDDAPGPEGPGERTE